MIIDASVISNFDRGSGPTVVTRLECSGDELSILKCPFDLASSDCSNSAGVQCYGMLSVYHCTSLTTP